MAKRRSFKLTPDGSSPRGRNARSFATVEEAFTAYDELTAEQRAVHGVYKVLDEKQAKYLKIEAALVMRDGDLWWAQCYVSTPYRKKGPKSLPVTIEDWRARVATPDSEFVKVDPAHRVSEWRNMSSYGHGIIWPHLGDDYTPPELTDEQAKIVSWLCTGARRAGSYVQSGAILDHVENMLPEELCADAMEQLIELGLVERFVMRWDSMKAEDPGQTMVVATYMGRRAYRKLSERSAA